LESTDTATVLLVGTMESMLEQALSAELMRVRVSPITVASDTATVASLLDSARDCSSTLFTAGCSWTIRTVLFIFSSDRDDDREDLVPRLASSSALGTSRVNEVCFEAGRVTVPSSDTTKGPFM
jgi:hypothetical protein